MFVVSAWSDLLLYFLSGFFLDSLSSETPFLTTLSERTATITF